MKNIEEINKASVKKILSKKKIPEFFAGDTLKVGVRIVEGKRERIQYFEGVCIAKKNRDINSSFTVRKISFGEGVERTFALYSPIVGSIKVIRSGKVTKSKLWLIKKAWVWKSLTLIGFDFFAKSAPFKVGEMHPNSWHLPRNTVSEIPHNVPAERDYALEMKRNGIIKWEILSDLKPEILEY